MSSSAWRIPAISNSLAISAEQQHCIFLWNIHRQSICRKRERYVPEAGKQATTGDFLLSGNPNDLGIYKWNTEKSGIPGVLPAESGRRKE